MVAFEKAEWNPCDFTKRAYTKCLNTQ